MPCRRLSAFGCGFSPSSLCSGALLSVSVGLWLLWRCTSWERKTPVDGTFTIWLFRYAWVIQRTDMTACCITLDAVFVVFCVYFYLEDKNLSLWPRWKDFHLLMLHSCSSHETKPHLLPYLFVHLVLYNFGLHNCSALSRHKGVPEQQKLCRHSSVSTSRPGALQPKR